SIGYAPIKTHFFQGGYRRGHLTVDLKCAFITCNGIFAAPGGTIGLAQTITGIGRLWKFPANDLLPDWSVV
ncbi:MAG: hypothetical protein AAFS08_18540, partial [Pseudomonadota bacterium]